MNEFFTFTVNELFAFTMISILYIQKNGLREYVLLWGSCVITKILYDCITKSLS